MCLALASVDARSADVFGTATPGVQATNDLRDRVGNLERELQELRRLRAEAEKAAPVMLPGQAVQGTVAGAGVVAGPKPRPVSRGVDSYAHLNKCYAGLPAEGVERSEIQQVHQRMKHEVVGTVNGKKLIRDLETGAVLALSEKELKEFEVQRCQAIVRQLKNDAVLSLPSPTGPGTPPPIPPTPMPVPKPGSAAPAAAAPAAPTKPADSKAPGAK